MKHWFAMGLAMFTYAGAPANAAIRAVFVGVDRYAYSQTNVDTAEFKDLRGAVADTQHIKAAFRSAYGLDLDVPAAGQCQSANSVSITLTDACATRAAVLKALDDQIKASSRGDTLIFYFAGHGSQVYDDQVFDQASQHNDTIMPTDARKPGASEPTDILDRELRDVIDRATSADVNVVTIFDSCNSGTATRGDIADGEGRSAPPLRVTSVRPATRSRGIGRGGGYRVHFAAAADGEVAREVGGAGVRSGVFTSALSQTLAAMPNASFADMAAEVRLKVSEGGHSLQTPQAEGELQATLGGKSRPVPLYEARPANGAVTSRRRRPADWCDEGLDVRVVWEHDRGQEGRSEAARNGTCHGRRRGKRDAHARRTHHCGAAAAPRCARDGARLWRDDAAGAK